MVYSNEDRVEIIFLYGKENRCALRTAMCFNEMNPDKNVSEAYVRQLVKKFQNTFSVKNIKRNSRLATEAKQIDSMAHIILNPQTSIRQVAAVSGISKSMVHRILRFHKFHPFKIHVHQELSEDDFDRRIEFSELMSEMLINRPEQLHNICFSDEATFSLQGDVNKHNCRYWSIENPRILREGHTQRPQKLNVWAGILGNNIVGPLFIDGNLNGDKYLDMLENNIDPAITDTIENNEGFNENIVIFQQDGAPPHHALPVRQFLNRVFPNRWIGRRGYVEWPARSPDLTPLDFFLWGYIKNKVYITQPDTLQILRERINAACREITPDMLQNVRNEFTNRLYYCLAEDGRHFEHLI